MSHCRQAMAARRKAIQDVRYRGMRKEAGVAQRRLARLVEREKDRQARKGMKR
jgi:hypothetical protein